MTNVTTVHDAIEAEPEDVGLSSSGLRNLGSTIERRIDDGAYPGAITAVVRHGKVAHFQTYGSMDIEAGRSMQPDTIFRIASMTKPIVSLALMQLYEQGCFQLDDPASQYIPEFRDLKVFDSGNADKFTDRDPAREMTVRDLLTHMSGLSAPVGRSGGGGPVSELYARANLPDFGSDETLHDEVVKLARLPLKCDPGSEWNYGLSTNVVGYLVEVLSGRPIKQYLEQHIFEPLGMTDTHFYLPDAKLDRLAALYRATPEGLKLLYAPADNPVSRPAKYFSCTGGLCSTAGNYIRFVKMLTNGGELDGERLIGQRTLDYMAQNHLPHGKLLTDLSPAGRFWPGNGFCLGFAVLVDPVTSGCLGSAGEYHWAGATSTHFFVSPSDDLALVFMTHVMAGAPPVAIGRDLRVGVYQAILD